MASVDVLAWEAEFPVFFKSLTNVLGTIDFVDEFGTPFWSKTNYVLLKPLHPIITSAPRKNPDAIHTIHTIFVADKSIPILLDEPRQLHSKAPVKVDKEIYLEAKSIFLSERNFMPTE